MTSEIYTLATTVTLVFIAELGDKTMISTAIFAVQTRRFPAVFLVSILGFTLANLISVGAGFVLRQALDLSIVQLIAALLFIIIGLWMLFLEKDQASERAKYGLTACFLSVFLSEMGDKTQLAVFSSAALYGLPLITLIGGIIGYALANAIGLILAVVASKRLKWSRVKKYAALIMIAIGAWLTLSVLVT